MILRCRLQLHGLSCIYTGRNRQRDCGATAVPQNKNIGIQQERLHGDTTARSRRATAASPGGNCKFELKIVA